MYCESGMLFCQGPKSLTANNVTQNTNSSAAAHFQVGTVTRSYDALHRLASEVTPQGAVGYGYDVASRRQTMQASGLLPVTYGYDTGSCQQE